MDPVSRSAPLARATWILLLVMLVACAALAWDGGFSLAAGRAAPLLLACLLLAGAWQGGRKRALPWLDAAALAFLQMTLFTVIGVVLAYVTAARAGPVWDGWLAAADRALGIDWSRWLFALDRQPALVVLLGVAYHSLPLQMVAAILLLTHHRRLGTMQVLVTAAIASGFVTILVAAVLPARGNLFDPRQFAHLWPSIAWRERDLIEGLRNGSYRRLDLTMLMGIVSFPSFHATLAALFIWAGRGLGIAGRGLGLLAGLTIAATPAFGGHYAVDVLAGLALAPPAVALAVWLARLDAPPRSTARPSRGPAHAPEAFGAEPC